MNSYLLVIGLLAWVRIGLAQTDPGALQIPTPRPPLVATPQPETIWYIASEPKKPSPATAPPANPADLQPIAIRAERGKEVTHIVATLNDGTTPEGYVLGSHYFQCAPQTGRILTSPTQERDYAIPIFVNGYQGTAWISLKQYQGVEKIDGQECYKYSQEASSASESDIAQPHPKLAAWIRVSDKIPMRIQIGDICYRYSFPKVGPLSIALPPEMAKVAQKMQKEEHSLEVMRTMSGQR